jgi:putative flippase GtrA
LGTTWIGLAMTSGIIGIADMVGANVVASKVLAVGISFAFNYFVRKHFIFGARRDAI